jgi:hypothetical protein
MNSMLYEALLALIGERVFPSYSRAYGESEIVFQVAHSQDSVRMIDASLIPPPREVEARIPGQLWENIVALLPQETATALSRCVHQTKPDNDAIKLVVGHRECVPGVEVCRDFHLYVA